MDTNQKNHLKKFIFKLKFLSPETGDTLYNEPKKIKTEYEMIKSRRGQQYAQLFWYRGEVFCSYQ